VYATQVSAPLDSLQHKDCFSCVFPAG